jgi:hypothetical protein
MINSQVFMKRFKPLKSVFFNTIFLNIQFGSIHIMRSNRHNRKIVERGCGADFKNI